MIRSLSTAVTGLRGHQQKLDVVGNNIANVNTVGFKMSQVRFEDLLSQTVQGATGPQERGGINPSQVGMGMRISSINDIHSQGAITSTDRETDLAIEGAGYFIVGDGTGNEYYTRAGSFGLDANGTLVNDNGMFLLGDRGAAVLEPITIPLGDEMVAQATGNMRFAGNLDSRLNPAYSFSLLEATEGSYTISFLDNGDLHVSGAIDHDATAVDIKAALEALPVIDTVSVTGLGTAANPFVVTVDAVGPGVDSLTLAAVEGDADFDGTIDSQPAGHHYEYYLYDSLGNRYAVDLAFTNSGENRWDYIVRVFDENQDPVAIDGGQSGTLFFNTSGIINPDATVIEPLEFQPAGAEPIVSGLDFSSVSQLAGANSLVVREQDGYAAGTLSGFYINRTGIVVGTFTNGMVENLGQIQTATFSNPEGLAKEGGNLFRATVNSGDPVHGNPGQGGRGLITSSALEMSNTDLAYEFTELITTSRAFQANTRVVTTSDEVLVEVVNMKR